MVKSGRAKLRDKKIQKKKNGTTTPITLSRGQKKRFEKKLMIERRNNMIKSPIMKGDQKKKTVITNQSELEDKPKVPQKLTHQKSKNRALFIESQKFNKLSLLPK